MEKGEEVGEAGRPSHKQGAAAERISADGVDGQCEGSLGQKPFPNMLILFLAAGGHGSFIRYFLE